MTRWLPLVLCLACHEDAAIPLEGEPDAHDTRAGDPDSDAASMDVIVLPDAVPSDAALPNAALPDALVDPCLHGADREEETVMHCFPASPTPGFRPPRADVCEAFLRLSHWGHDGPFREPERLVLARYGWSLIARTYQAGTLVFYTHEILWATMPDRWATNAPWPIPCVGWDEATRRLIALHCGLDFIRGRADALRVEPLEALDMLAFLQAPVLGDDAPLALRRAAQVMDTPGPERAEVLRGFAVDPPACLLAPPPDLDRVLPCACEEEGAEWTSGCFECACREGSVQCRSRCAGDGSVLTCCGLPPVCPLEAHLEVREGCWVCAETP